MTPAADTVFIVDDDPGVRESLDNLLRSVGYLVTACASVEDFLRHKQAADCACREGVCHPSGACCLILDIRMRGESGLDLQAHFVESQCHMPIIFITGHGDIAMSVRAMKAGAVEFLAKPFREQDLLDAVQEALERDRRRRGAQEAAAELRLKFEALTPREREIMAYVATGRLNKQIASAIGVSEITVKVHRGQVMRKMNAKSLPDLVRMADRLGLSTTPGS
jgi:FixJ family two-component response regulator